MKSQEEILTKLKKFDIYVKGTDGMSKKQTDAFNNLIRGRMKALSICIAQDGQEASFVAADDQWDAYQKEFNCQVKFRIEPGTIFIDQIPND